MGLDVLRSAATSAAARVHAIAGRLLLSAKRATGQLEPLRVQPYRGYGTAEEVHLNGRVREETGVTGAALTDTAWRNARNMLRRFSAAPIPGATVRVRLGPGSAGHGPTDQQATTEQQATTKQQATTEQATTDADGYFRTTLTPPRPLTAGWHDVPVDLLWPYARGQQGDQATGQVLVPRADAAFGVISDLDDTVIRTGLSSLLLTARIVVLGNARTRSPFRGVAAFYSALQQGVDGSGRNPVFYVSSSPWNLYDVVEEFLDLNSIPVGPLFLRGWGLEPGTLPGGGHAGHKSEQIERLLSTYPELAFVLIGDSGQQDPEIYRDVALARPDRVRAVYLRDVTSPERDREVHAIAREVSAAGVDFILVPDTLAAARHAVEHGLIAASALDGIAAEAARDSAGNTGDLIAAGGDVG